MNASVAELVTLRSSLSLVLLHSADTPVMEQAAFNSTDWREKEPFVRMGVRMELKR